MTLRVFIGMETSGALRRRFQSAGAEVISCDLFPAEDDGFGHVPGDVFETLHALFTAGWVPDVGVFHPTCTFHVTSAAWAFSEPDFNRYPGVGYHQKVKPGTLVGQARHHAREAAERDLEKIRLLPIRLKIAENPRGTIPTRTKWGQPADVVQPYEFGDDASKTTCLWAFDKDGNPVPFTLPRDPALRVSGRWFDGKERWENQTGGGYNKLGDYPDRWKDRSRTFPGIADAIVQRVMGGAT